MLIKYANLKHWKRYIEIIKELGIDRNNTISILFEIISSGAKKVKIY